MRVEAVIRRASNLQPNAEFVVSANAAIRRVQDQLLRLVQGPAEAAFALAQQSLELSQQALDQARREAEASFARGDAEGGIRVRLDHDLDPLTWSEHDEVELSDAQMEAVRELAARQRRQRAAGATERRPSRAPAQTRRKGKSTKAASGRKTVSRQSRTTAGARAKQAGRRG